jgi:hypothetical protein
MTGCSIPALLLSAVVGLCSIIRLLLASCLESLHGRYDAIGECRWKRIPRVSRDVAEGVRIEIRSPALTDSERETPGVKSFQSKSVILILVVMRVVARLQVKATFGFPLAS